MDHLIRWIMADVNRLKDFNSVYATKFPKKVMQNRGDFEEIPDFDIIEFCRQAKLLSKNAVEILRTHLKRRNAAAHPSTVVITQAQADDTISDLLNNIIISLR